MFLLEGNGFLSFCVGDGIDIPIYVIVRFMQRRHFNQRHDNNYAFYRRSVVIALCFYGSKKFLDVGINCFFAIDNNSQAYGETVSCFRQLAKDNILQP